MPTGKHICVCLRVCAVCAIISVFNVLICVNGAVYAGVSDSLCDCHFVLCFHMLCCSMPCGFGSGYWCLVYAYV